MNVDHLRLSPGYSIIIKPVSYSCNLACRYCYYLKTNELYPDDQHPRMTDAVLEETIRQYLAQPIPHITFSWQGGESTMLGVGFFERVLELIKKHNTGGKTVMHSFQTNGTLLDDEWCSFFKRENFLVGISIDGPADLHDAYRVDRGGKPSHGRVMAGLRKLQEHGVEYNALVLLNSLNVRHPDEVYNFLVDRGVRYLQFIPCLETGADGTVAPYAVPAGAYGAFLNGVFDIWKKRDVGTVFIQIIEEHLTTLLGRPANLCIHAPVCGRALVVEYNGDLYSCDHFVDRDHRLGNIMETPMARLVDSTAQNAFGRSKALVPDECVRCTWRASCGGGCLKHRVAGTGAAGNKRNHFCADYKAFYEHSYPELYEIARGLLERHRAPQPAEGPGRNDPCPCGSGKKYKKCCGV